MARGGEAARTPRFCPAFAGHAYAWMFYFSPQLRDTLTRGLRKRYSRPAVAGHAYAWIEEKILTPRSCGTRLRAQRPLRSGRGGSRVRGTRLRADLGFWMFNFSPQLRDTLTRGLRKRYSRPAVAGHADACKAPIGSG